jgi:radical SAM protein with 4Fe4S-binding SPASM domain
MKPNVDAIGRMYRLAEDLGIPFNHDDTLFVSSDGSRGPLALQIPDCDIVRIRKRIGGDDTFEPSICNAGRSILSISPDGSVYPCGAFPEKAGNIRETALETIWYDAPVMKKLRTITDDDYRVCSDCTYLLRCNGCVAMGLGLASGRTVPCLFARKNLRHFV